MVAETTETRESIRADLQAAREQYLAVLDELGPGDWKRKTANPAWNVGQLLWHTALSLGFTARGIKGLRKGRGFNVPGFLAHPLNTWTTKLGSLRATPASVRQKYEDAHRALLAALDEVGPDEWQKGATVLGEFRTVEGAFRNMPAHVEEHTADVRAALGR